MASARKLNGIPDVAVVLPVVDHLGVAHQLFDQDWLATGHVLCELEWSGRYC